MNQFIDREQQITVETINQLSEQEPKITKKQHNAITQLLTYLVMAQKAPYTQKQEEDNEARF